MLHVDRMWESSTSARRVTWGLVAVVRVVAGLVLPATLGSVSPQADVSGSGLRLRLCEILSSGGLGAHPFPFQMPCFSDGGWHVVVGLTRTLCFTGRGEQMHISCIEIVLHLILFM